MGFDLGSRNWKDMRELALNLFGSCCMRCGATPNNSVIQVDHIKPRSKHPDLAFDFSNLQILCSSCNKEKLDKTEDDYRNVGQKALAASIQEGISSYIDFESNDRLDAEAADRKSRTLASYVRSKLGISLVEFARAEGVNHRTLYDRWNSPKGRTIIENAVFRFYVTRFDDL